MANKDQKGVTIPMEMFEQFEKLSAGFLQNPENVIQRLQHMLKEKGENESSAPGSQSQQNTVAIPMEMFERLDKLSAGFHQSPEEVVQRFKQLFDEQELEEESGGMPGEYGDRGGANERGESGRGEGENEAGERKGRR